MTARLSRDLGREMKAISLANVIFPAFAAPYVSAMLFPIAGIAALAVEVWILRMMNRGLAWRGIVGLARSIRERGNVLCPEWPGNFQQRVRRRILAAESRTTCRVA